MLISLDHALDERGVGGGGGELEVLLVVLVGLRCLAGAHVALAQELVYGRLLGAHLLGLLAARAGVGDLALRQQLLGLGHDLARAPRGWRRLGRRGRRDRRRGGGDANRGRSGRLGLRGGDAGRVPTVGVVVTATVAHRRRGVAQGRSRDGRGGLLGGWGRFGGGHRRGGRGRGRLDGPGCRRRDGRGGRLGDARRGGERRRGSRRAAVDDVRGGPSAHQQRGPEHEARGP